MSKDILAAIADLRGDLMDRLDRLQTSVDGIRDDITVVGGMNDTTRRAGDNTRDELRDLARNVGDMQRVLLKHGTRLDVLEKR